MEKMVLHESDNKRRQYRSHIMGSIEAEITAKIIIDRILTLAFEELSQKALMIQLPIHAAMQSQKISESLIKKNLISWNHLPKPTLQQIDVEPKTINKDVWLRFATRSVPNIQNKTSSISTPNISQYVSRASGRSQNSHKLQLLPSKKQYSNDHTLSINLQNTERYDAQEGQMRKKKRDQYKKLNEKDDKKRIRKGIHMVESDMNLLFNNKDKKFQKLAYDDEGRRINLNIERYHPPDQNPISFQYQKIKIHRDSKGRHSKISINYPLIKVKQRFNMGHSTYEMNKLDVTPFGTNFLYRQSLDNSDNISKQQKSDQKLRRNSFNLFQQTQAFLKTRFNVHDFANKDLNRSSFRYLISGQLTPNKEAQNSVSQIEQNQIQKIKVFNKQLLRKIHQIGEEKGSDPRFRTHINFHPKKSISKF